MEKKKQNVFVLALVALVVLIGVYTHVVELIKFIQSPGWVMLVLNAGEILFYALLLYYVFAGYKKPHGNLLRHLMLAFALFIALHIVIAVGNTLGLIARIVAAMLITYMAGRLNKLRQNIVIMALVAILLFVTSMNVFIEYGFTSVHEICAFSGLFIQWLVFCAAYFVRYKEHKESGLMDAPKAK